MVSHYEHQLQSGPDRSRVGRLHFECARLYEYPLQDLAKAAEHYTKAQSLLPDHVPTIRGARRVQLAQGNHQQAAALFDAEVRLTSDNKRKAGLLRDKGVLVDGQGGNRRAALTALANAAQLDPGNLTWLKPLALTQLQEEAWTDLGHTLERTANLIESDTRYRAALVSERARLFEAHHKDYEQAAELYKSALGHDPRAPGAVHALKQLDFGQRRWRDLIQVLEHEAEQAAEPDVKALALYRIGRVEIDRLGNLDGALAALERAAQITPDDSMILGELARLHELATNHESLARVLERLVAHAETPTEKVGLLARIARLHEEHLADEDTAIAWYARALTIDPGFSPVLRALERLYEKREQWQPLIGILVNAATATQDPVRRACHHAAIAEIYERRLDDATHAIEHHAQALGLVPGHEVSFKALSRLFETLGRFRELIELHERAVEQTANIETQISHLFKIGLYLEDALKLPARAIESYKRILGLDSKHLGAIFAWQRAAERAGEWADLVRALETEAHLSPDKEHTAHLLHRAGEILSERLDDIDGALERHRKVLGLMPKHHAALTSMERIFETQGRWEDLLEAYRRELNITPPGTAAAALRCSMAELCEHRLGRDDEALTLYREAVDVMPQHQQAREALERKLAKLEKWSDLVKVLEQALGAAESPAERAHLGGRIGEIYENHLEAAGKALAAYDTALKSVPNYRPALDGRTRLLAQARSFARLADDLAREAEHTRDSHLTIAARYREGQIRRDELNDPSEAIRCFEAVLGVDPRHLGALLALEALYARVERWNDVATNYTTQDQVLAEASARVAALHQLAHVQSAHELSERGSPRQTYFSILQVEPDNLAALSALEHLSLMDGDAQLLAQVDAKLASMVQEADLASAHHARLGEALEGTDPVTALDVYRSALARDPDNETAAHGFARIAESRSDVDLLEEAAEYQFRVAADTTTAAGLLVKAARGALPADPARAVKALRRALEIDPDSNLAALHLHRVLVQTGDVDTLIDALTHAAQKSRTREHRADLWVLIAGLYADQKQDVPAGLAALKRVVAQDSTNVGALMQLATLYARDGQWDPATAHLNDVLLQSPETEIRTKARLLLAEIYDDHLRQTDRALQNVNGILNEDPDHREALHRRLSILLHTGQHSAAAEAAERLIATATSPRTRAEAQVTLAQVERARGNPSAAIQYLEGAVAVLGLEGRGAVELKALISEQRSQGHPPSWRGYVAALEKYAQVAPRQPDVLTPVFLEISRVLSNELRQNDEALAVVEQGLSMAPDAVELHADRALRLEHKGDLGGAAEAWRGVLNRRVTQPEAWRALSSVLAKMGRQADAAITLAPLVALGAASEAEQSRIASLPVRAGMAAANSLSTEEFASLDPLGGTDPAEVMLSLLGEILPKLVPTDFARLGLSPRDKITARSGHPLRYLTDRVATIFGLPDHHLYVHQVHSGLLEVELTEPVSIIVPAYLMNLSEAQQVFLLARIMANAVRRLSAVDRLPPHEIELLLVATAESLGYSARTGLDSTAVSDQARRISRLLSRRTRRSIEEVAPQFAGAPPPDFAEWVAQVRTAAARAALLVSDELPGSIALVRRLEGDLAGTQGEVRERGIRLAEDLLRFWASDTAFQLRRRMGLL